MTRQDLIDFCLTFPAVYEDYPFDETADANATAVMRHWGNKKSFALIMRHSNKLYLNLKCDPFEAEFLRQAFLAVIPGWHMNHTHWNTVVCDENCDVPEEALKRMIEKSYGLTRPKNRKRQEEAFNEHTGSHTCEKKHSQIPSRPHLR
ncbi:MAG: MmcQ/YjbR family DNA-binding protein [Eubacteriales bacterium]|nr:MmcQ/YjbR family DNA-binding protein [Eubacteriales bacterium]